jgi:hypothetical protein
MSIGISQEVQSYFIEEVKSGLVFSELEYDFGTVNPDTVLNHVFTFKNASSDTIKINKVAAT